LDTGDTEVLEPVDGDVLAGVEAHGTVVGLGEQGLVLAQLHADLGRQRGLLHALRVHQLVLRELQPGLEVVGTRHCTPSGNHSWG